MLLFFFSHQMIHLLLIKIYHFDETLQADNKNKQYSVWNNKMYIEWKTPFQLFFQSTYEVKKNWKIEK